MAIRGKIFVALLLVLTLVALTPAFAGDKEKLGDAWWTGPLQTPSPNTIPKNHWYVETYFAVEQDNGVYVNNGTKFGANNKFQGSGYDNNYESTTLFTYGVTNKLNLQILLGMDGTQGGTGVASTGGLEVNTLRIRLPYNVLKFKQGGTPLSFAIVPEVNTPVSNYPENTAIWTPGVGFWVQRPFWMPTGRILRIRASEDIWFPMSGKNCGAGCSLDAAKYGQTQVGFEYSLTKHWVPAFDFVWKYYGQNKVNGVAVTGPVTFAASGATLTTGPLAGRRDFRIDPALEYNFTENTGIIFGAEITVGGKNTGSYIAPQIALQWFK
jgi:hypothetical protein